MLQNTMSENEINTVKLLNSGHLRALKYVSIIKRCPLLGGSLTKIVTFGTNHFVRYSRHVRYWEVSLYYDLRQKSQRKDKNIIKTFNFVFYHSI